MATLQTNLSSSPYFDTFKETGNYYRVLYKPSVAVQVRELNEVQSIFQDQINKLGRSVFKEGSIIEGCTFSFDFQRPYIKISDNYSNSTAFTISDFQDKYVINSNGLKALIVDTRAGFSSQAPNTNTLYVKYRNSAIYANGVSQKTFDPGEQLTIVSTANVSIGNVSVLTVANSIGVSYAVKVTDGVIFKKGLMLNVKGQSLTVLPYANNPDNLSVGFEAVESIETAAANSQLYDNAAGSPNYLAPGADRLRIDPTLVVRATDSITNSSNFFSLIDFKNGNPVTIKQDPQVEILTDEIARRTFETSGDFVVAPFIMTTENLANTSSPEYATKLNLVVSRGLGYVKGYRIEYLNNNVAKFRKSTDYKTVKSQIITANFGNYFYVNEVAGQFGSNSSIISVDLYNTPLTSVSSGGLLGVSPSPSNKIGTGYIRGFSYVDGSVGSPDARYRLYLFNYADNMTSSFSPSDVRSIVYNSGGVKGVADIILQKQGTLATNTAVMQQANLNTMLFTFGQQALKTDGFNNTGYVYRSKISTSVLSNGNAAITIPAAAGTGTETLPYGSGQLSQALQQQFHVVATSTGTTANLTGNVSVSSSSNVVGGAYGTAFLSTFYPGDYIYVNGDSRLVTSVTNNISLNVLSPFSASNGNANYAKTFPAGSVVPISDRPSRYIFVTSSTTATIVLGESLTSSFNIDVHYNTNRTSTVPMSKVVNEKVYVKIRPANNVGGLSGPWSLGLPDAYELTGAWITNDGTYANSGTDYKQWFKLDSGQRDGHYGLASLSLATATPPGTQINANTRIVAQLSCFTYDQSQGKGFFTANSYPIDDANTANTNAIQTAQIPRYISSKGTSYDLRSVVDFRPVASNTANVSTTLASATINPSSTISFNTTPYLPTPDSEFQSDYQYYLRRIDRVALDTNGNIVITEGTPVATNPAAPVEQSGTMTLGLLFVPPYPTLSSSEGKQYNRPEYTVSTQQIQNRRYTMKNVGELEKRIQNIEYYTSLNLLEQAASTILVRSSTTGQNRFQNGLFADPFRDHSYSNLNDPQYYIGVDSSATELRPAHVQYRSTLQFNAALSSSVVQKGKLIMLSHTSNNKFITQGFASKYRNCVEGNIFHYKGTVTLDPFGTITPDINKPVTVLNNTLDLTKNWQTLDNAWGTQWGNWTEVANTRTTTNLLISGTKRETGNFDKDPGQEYRDTTQTLTNISQTYQQAGTTLNSSIVSKKDFNLGTYITDVSIQPWLKSSTIKMYIRGMKPNTRLYVYLDNKSMSADNIAPFANGSFVADANYTATSSSSGLMGDALYSDSRGRAWALMYIPPHDPRVPGSGFQARELPVLVNDISDLTQGADAATTSAEAIFVGSGLTVQKGQSILSTKDVELSFDRVVSNTRTVDVLGYTQTVKITDVPPPSSCGCGGCFTYDTLVEMHDGSTKRIVDVEIGDRVYNWNKTEINTVKFVEKTLDNRFEKIYSPSRALKPFATINHPIFIDGKLSSVDPAMNYEFYPWLGMNETIKDPVLEDASGNLVYNLWVDGDGTYTVNGYGTTSIIGDGAAARQAVEYGFLTAEEVVDIVNGYAEAGAATSYGSYIFIRALASIDIKPLTWLAAKMVKNEGVSKKIISGVFNIIGRTALLFSKK